MADVKQLVGKKFKSIEDSERGNIKITFQDGTVAYFGCIHFPDGTVRDVYLENIKEGNI